jgi:hypothetical protein
MRAVAVCIAVVAGGLAAAPASAAPQRHLRVVTTAGGTVSTADGRVECGFDCRAAYRRGSVLLRARPDGDFRFAYWTGGCVGLRARCRVALTRVTTVRATFERRRRHVRLIVSGPGTVSADATRLRCGSAAARCGTRAGQGTSVRLVATPDAGAVFDSWADGPCAASATPTCDVAVTGHTEIAAVFRRATPVPGTAALALDVVGDVRSVPAGIDCPSTCTASYASGTAVTLRALSELVWRRGCVGFGRRCTVIVDGPVNVFASIPPPATDTRGYGLTIGVTGPGTVVGSGLRCGGRTGSAIDCRGVFAPGSKVKLKAVAARGARFVGWTGFCQLAGRRRQCQVTVSTGKTVGAIFRR